MMATLLRAVATLLALIAIASPVRAQTPVKVTSTLSAEVVEINDSVSLELSVVYDEGRVPEKPTLKVPAGLTAMEPRIFRGNVHDLVRGTRQTVYRARWQLVANQVGTFEIAAPTVTFEGRLLRGEAHTVKVVPPGQAARKRRQPFGGFGGFFLPPQTSFDFDLRELLPVEPPEPTNERLSMTRAPDPHVFLRLIPSKTKAVVGEQITLEYWAYSERHLRFGNGQPREPSLVDFSRMDLERPRDVHVQARVGHSIWDAQLFGRVAIFPLRAGKLATGRIELDVLMPRLGRREVTRSSNDVVIEVVEPPKEDRPANYTLGNVGRFKLAATLSPHETVVGETVSVQVKVTGVGQLPSALDVPKKRGVEWLDPEKREEIRGADGPVHGWRTFGYAVRFTEPGNYDLGAIELPYYDPDAGRYEVARAEIGQVRVKPKPGGAVADTSNDEPDPLATLGGPRATLGAYEPARDDGLDPRWLWSLTLAPPLFVVSGTLLTGALSNLRQRRRKRRDDPATLARRALGEAREAKDAKDAAAAAERAMHLAIEARTGVKARGVLLADLGPRLRARGLDQELADEVVALLESLGTLRFAPRESSGDALHQRSADLVKKLLA